MLGVPCYSGFCSEVYLEKAFDSTGWRPANRLAVAKVLGETSLMFLVHPTLKDQEIEKPCKVVAELMGRVMRNKKINRRQVKGGCKEKLVHEDRWTK